MTCATKRILIAHNVPNSRTGGMSRIMGFIHDRVAQHGFEISEFNAAHAPNYAKGKLNRFGFGWAVFRHIRNQYLSGKPYDVVNIHEPSAAMTCYLRRYCGNPYVVVTSHGVEQRAWEVALDELRLGRAGPSKKTQWIYPATQLSQSNFALRHADHIFCLNEEDRGFILSRYRRCATDTTRLFPGADLAFMDATVNRDYGRCKRLLFAGTWRKNKGIEDMVPAFSLILKRHPEMTLVILGGGFPTDIILGSFSQEVRANVQIVQASTETETIQAFADSDIFVLPSLFEGTPLVLMEAMMSGLPIVTTETCGMKDVIESGTTGLLVPIRSPERIVGSVTSLITCPGLRERLGKSASLRARREFTWDTVSTPVTEAYKRFCRL